MSTPGATNCVLSFPDVRQDHGGGCGVAVLRACFKWSGKEEPEGLDSLADESGFLGGVEQMEETISLLGSPVHTSLLFPCVALIIDEDHVEHWVVITGRSQFSVFFHCPQEGPRVVPIALFDSFWSDPNLSVQRLGISWV